MRLNWYPPSTPHVELERRRDAVQRGLRRANTVGIGILAVVIGLAASAIGLAQRSARDARLAEEERRRAEEQLFQASLSQVQAQRLAARMGQRTRSLDAIRLAAQIRRTAELREQAIAALALSDLEDGGRWHPLPVDTSKVVVDAAPLHYAFVSARTNIQVRRLRDGQTTFNTGGADLHDPSIRLSADGRYLAAWTPSVLRVWDTVQHKEAITWEAPPARELRRVDLDPKGRRIAFSDGENVVRVLDLESQARIAEVRGLDQPWNIAFHPREDQLAIECAKSIRLCQWPSGQVDRELAYANPGTASLAWRQDGRALAVNRFDHLIDVWDLESGRSIQLQGHTREVLESAFDSTSGLLVSFAWDNTLRLWDTLAGVQLLQTSGVRPLGFSHDGTRLAVWRQPEGLGFFRVHAPKVCRSFIPASGMGRPSWTLDFSGDSSRLVTANDEGFWLMDLASGERTCFGESLGCRGAYFLDDIAILTVGGTGLHRWLLPAGATQNGSRLGPPGPMAGAPAHRFGLSALNSDRSRLAAHVDDAGFGEVIELSTGEVRRELRGQTDFSGPEFSPDGRWIASGCWNPNETKAMFAAVWDATTGRLIQRLPGTKCSVAFSPDSRWLVLGLNTEYRLIRTGTWAVERVFQRSGTVVDNGVAAFSPDGRLLALHATDRVLRLVAPDNGKELARLNAPGQRILKRMRFSPDGRWLASSTEADVQVWDLRTLRQELGVLGLDWDEREQPPLPLLTTATLAVTGSRGDMMPVVIPLILVIMAVAVGMTFWLRRYQRSILERYVEVEALSARRGEQLALAQTELMHGQKMRALGTLAAGIAHDFNNLLSVIRMSGGLIARQARGHAEILENTSEIEHAVRQGKEVVRSMLGYSRESCDPPAPCSMPELVEDTVGLLSKEFLSGITLSLELDRAAPLVKVSRARLEQVLLNLVVNASEAMRSQGHLLIAVRSTGLSSGLAVLEPRAASRHVELVVTDSGPGISPDVLPRIFEPFFTTKNAGATRGTGLGLSLVYAVAHDEGLGLRVETTPGKGTTFRLLVPYANTDVEPPREEP